MNFIRSLPDRMAGRLKHIILAFLGLVSVSAYSQSNCITDPPLPPVLQLVTVLPETGYTLLNWSLSQSPGIAAYIIYSYKNGDASAIDTIWNPTATSYTHATTGTKYLSVSYVVAAMRLPRCTSILSNQINTIFNSSIIDTCNKKIVIKWNKYPDQPHQVKEYKISISINGGSFSEMYTTSKESDSFTITDFTTNSNYCTTIRAIRHDGSISESNKSCISTKMQRPPDWINADYATVRSDKKISLSFTIDPLSEITKFILERKIENGVNYNEISKPVSVNSKVEFNDSEADITKVYYYRLSAVNNCNIPVIASNISSNIKLSMLRNGNFVDFWWNSYKKWRGNISSYRLFVNTGNGFRENALINPQDSVFRLNYNDIMYDVTGNEVCFKINAEESDNPLGITGISNSSVTCLTPEEIITVPNIFTPDKDAINDLFSPVLSFTPLDYQLIITDRKGKVIFETTDHSLKWDGSVNGTPLSQGVYLWYLKVKTPSGKIISKTGTITIFINHN